MDIEKMFKRGIYLYSIKVLSDKQTLDLVFDETNLDGSLI